MKATIGARSVLWSPRFENSPESYGSLCTYLPLKVLDSLISERRLPLKGLGLMALINLRRVNSDTFSE